MAVAKASQAIAVTGHVEPVASPSFAIVLGVEQMVDHLGKGIGSGVGQKSLHFLRFRREAYQVEIYPAYDDSLVRLRVWFDPGGLKLGENEVIQFGPHPILPLHHWGSLLGNGLKGPMFTSKLVPVVRFLLSRNPKHDFPLEPRPRRAHLHPVLKDFHLFGLKRFLRRHRHVLVAIAYRLDDATLGEVARH